MDMFNEGFCVSSNVLIFIIGLLTNQLSKPYESVDPFFAPDDDNDSNEVNFFFFSLSFLYTFKICNHLKIFIDLYPFKVSCLVRTFNICSFKLMKFSPLKFLNFLLQVVFVKLLIFSLSYFFKYFL